MAKKAVPDETEGPPSFSDMDIFQSWKMLTLFYRAFDWAGS